MNDDICGAENCGRVHGLDGMFSGFDDTLFCSFHRGKLEAGEGVICQNGDIARYDDVTHHGLYRIPPTWEPHLPLPDLSTHEGWNPGETRELLDDAIVRVRKAEGLP